MTFGISEIDNTGMVIDFGEVKDYVGQWIDANWDHAFLANIDDPILEFEDKLFPDKEPYIFDCEPTAENMAETLFDVVTGIVLRKWPLVTLKKVVIWETPNCCASYTG